MEDRHGIAELRGCPLAYTIRGNGPPVLFIQGVGVHGDGWLPQIEQMSATYSCVSFDNRGMGRSQPAGAAITVEQMAADAEAVLQTAQIERAHVVGHSLGGLVALQLALALRQRVVSLSLLCTFALGRAAAPLSARMFWLGLRSRVGTRRMRREAFLRLILPPGVAGGPDVTAEQLAAIFGHDLADQPPVVSAQLRAMRQADATARLGALASPTLVVSAAHDPIAPPALGRALAAAIRGAEYVEFATPRTGCRSRTRGTSTRCCSGTCSRRRPPPWQPERLGHPTSRATGGLSHRH